MFRRGARDVDEIRVLWPAVQSSLHHGLDTVVVGLRVKGYFAKIGVVDGTIMSLKVVDGEGVAGIKLDSEVDVQVLWRQVGPYLAAVYPQEIADMKFAAAMIAIEAVVKTSQTSARPARTRARHGHVDP